MPQNTFPSPSANPAQPKFVIANLVSRNVRVNRRRTSLRLEPSMWNALGEVCRRELVSMHEIATWVSQHKTGTSKLTAAMRVFIMNYFRAASTEEGHSKRGHGLGLLQRAVKEESQTLSVLPEKGKTYSARGAR